MVGYQTVVPGAIEEGRNMTIQLACWPLASRSDPLAELVRALARDFECAINAGSKSNGVGGAGTLQEQTRNPNSTSAAFSCHNRDVHVKQLTHGYKSTA